MLYLFSLYTLATVSRGLYISADNHTNLNNNNNSIQTTDNLCTVHSVK